VQELASQAFARRLSPTLGVMASETDLEQVAVLAETASLNMPELDRRAASVGLGRLALIDAVSLHVAKQYDDGKLDFGRGDRIMNGLWGLICSQPAEAIKIPEITQHVYEAFDQVSTTTPVTNQGRIRNSSTRGPCFVPLFKGILLVAPNPFIEQTAASRLRRLAAAAHVER
jgi:hypothetical protein